MVLSLSFCSIFSFKPSKNPRTLLWSWLFSYAFLLLLASENFYLISCLMSYYSYFFFLTYLLVSIAHPLKAFLSSTKQWNSLASYSDFMSMLCCLLSSFSLSSFWNSTYSLHALNSLYILNLLMKYLRLVLLIMQLNLVKQLMKFLLLRLKLIVVLLFHQFLN